VYCLWRDETLYRFERKIWTQSSSPQRSYCDFNIWPRPWTCFKRCARLLNNFHQVWPSTTYLCQNYSVFDTDTFTLWSWPLTRPLTLKVRGTSSVTWWNFVRNLSEIEQSSAELLLFCEFLHTLGLCHAVTSTFDLLTLHFYYTSGIMRLNSVQNLTIMNWWEKDEETVTGIHHWQVGKVL